MSEDQTGTFLDFSYAGTPEMKLVASGEQAKVTCLKATHKSGRDKEQNEWRAVNMILSVVGDDTVPDFYYTAWIYNEGDTQKQANQKADDWRRVCTAFGLDGSSGIDLTDFINAEADAILGQTDDMNGKEVNAIKRFL